MRKQTSFSVTGKSVFLSLDQHKHLKVLSIMEGKSIESMVNEALEPYLKARPCKIVIEN